MKNNLVMNFQFDLKTSVEESLNELFYQIIENAAFDCSTKELDAHEKIHSLRKKCKQIRALLRIVKPRLGTRYKEENILFRNLSRKLSNSRDAQVCIDTLIKVQKIPNNRVDSEAAEELLNILVQERDLFDTDKLISDFSNEIQIYQNRNRHLKVKGNGFKCLKGGLKKTYKRGQTAMYTAFKKPTVENYHEWRKRAKYHYHHLELLTHIWENLLCPYTQEAHRLSELLGYDHDLSLLKDNFNYNSKLNLVPEIKNYIVCSIENEQEEVRVQISKLGLKIYAEKPRHFVRRIRQYWKSSINNSQ